MGILFHCRCTRAELSVRAALTFAVTIAVQVQNRISLQMATPTPIGYNSPPD